MLDEGLDDEQIAVGGSSSDVYANFEGIVRRAGNELDEEVVQLIYKSVYAGIVPRVCSVPCSPPGRFHTCGTLTPWLCSTLKVAASLNLTAC